MKRAGQKIENTWKLEDIYASREAYEKDAAALKAQIAEFSGYQGKLGDGPQMLLEILKKRDAMAKIMSRMIVYSNQHYHEDTGNAVYQKLAGEAQTLSVKFSQACAWWSRSFWHLSRNGLRSILKRCRSLKITEERLHR